MMGMTLMENHECLHEDMLLGQSRKIERLDAELRYKKERLDELKEDTRRMERKIEDVGKSVDDMNESIHKFILKSNEADSDIKNRVTALEQQNKDLIKQIEDTKTESNVRVNRLLVVFGLGLTCITIILDVVFHYIGG